MEGPSLAADERLVELLAGPGPFTVLEHHERVGSTNDVARERLAEGADPGLVVVADRQTAGRGRRGRRWIDDLEGPGGPANLAVTATMPAPEDHVTLAVLAAGLAVADTCESMGAGAALKWPNDVLLDGRKVAGILLERHRLRERDVLLVGCGLDVDWRGVSRSGSAADWTSLAESLGGDVDRGRVVVGLLAALGDRFASLGEDPDGVLADYQGRCCTLGRQVRVTVPGGEVVAGTAVTVDADGRLVVDTPQRRVAVVAGDVVHAATN